MIDINRDVEILIGRILIMIIFVMSLLGKVFGFRDSVIWTESYFTLIPGELLIIAAIIVEIIGITSILLGWKMRIGAYALIIFTIPVTFIFHTDFSLSHEIALFFKNFAIVGALLLLARMSPGKYSIDG